MIDSESFRGVLGCFASGVAIVTARDRDRDVGMTVSAFTSLSLTPPLVLVCVSHAASMHQLLLSHPKIGISILASGQEACSRRFADRSETQRFDGVAFSRGENSALLLDDALAHLECQLVGHHDAGDHTIFVAQVERAARVNNRPLLYYRGRYAQLEAMTVSESR